MSDRQQNPQSILGIIAGGGSLPGLFVHACREQGREFRLVALKEQFTPDTVPATPDAEFRIGQGGGIVEYLRGEGVSELVFGGAIRRPSLSELRPDALSAKVMVRAGLGFIGDDGALRAIIGAFEDEGFSILAAENLVDGLLMPLGPLGARSPDKTAQLDIDRGLAILQSMGVLDIGQAVVIQEGQVLGIEAVEGTDRLIERCGELKKDAPGGVLVKIAKPQQERRVDLPTIGPDTMERAIKAGLRGIAVESEGTLVIDRETLVAQADEAGLFVTGLKISS